MIKKVTLIKKLTDKFQLPVDVLEVSPPLSLETHPLEAEFLTGGFYKTGLYNMAAFYVSDSDGNILDTEPIIMEEGVNSYVDIFSRLDYNFI